MRLASFIVGCILLACSPKPADDAAYQMESLGGTVSDSLWLNAAADTMFIPTYWTGGDGNGTGWRTVGRRDKPLPAEAFWQPDLPISARGDTIVMPLGRSLVEGDTVVFRTCVSKLRGTTKWPEKCTKPGTYVHSFPPEQPDSVWWGEPWLNAAFGMYRGNPTVGYDEFFPIGGQFAYAGGDTLTACLDPDPDPKKVFARALPDGSCEHGDSTYVAKPFRGGLCLGVVQAGVVFPRAPVDPNGDMIAIRYKGNCQEPEAWAQSAHAGKTVVPHYAQTNAQRDLTKHLNCVRFIMVCGSERACKHVANGVMGCDQIEWRVWTSLPEGRTKILGVIRVA